MWLVMSTALALEPPVFSVQRGFQSGPVFLELSHPDPTVDIHYTLDGEIPNFLLDPIYSSGLSITNNAYVRAMACNATECSEPVTHTYLYMNDILNQTMPAGVPDMWGDAPADYDMDPEVVTDPVWGPQVEPSLRGLPVMSMVIPMDDMFDVDNGIYNNSTLRAPQWDRACSIEYWDDTTGESIQVNAGTHISGGASRTQTRSPKHSFRLMFKSEYGPANLDHDFFGPGAVDEFDTLHLRAGYNNTWHHWEDNNRERAQYARDEYARRLHRMMGGVAAHGRFIHLYVNGLYWGVHNLHERPDAGFLSRYLGGSKSDWDALNSGDPTDGDDIAWQALIARAALDQSDPVNYASTLELLDLDPFIDYLILNHWLSNTDWDDKNWYASHFRQPGGKFLFHAWDSESTIKTTIDEDVTITQFPDKPTGFHFNLMANPEYRLRFADRIHLQVNLGPLQPSIAGPLFTEVTDEVEAGIVAESARWGDYRRDVLVDQLPTDLYDKDYWDTERDRVLNTWLPPRGATTLTQWEAHGLWPASAPSVVSPATGRHPAGTNVTMSAGVGGTTYYTLDGTDPRLEGGAVAPGATAFSAPFPLATAIRIRARHMDSNGEWSALTPSDVLVDQPFDDLVINELHYNPDNGGAEFIELHNRGAVPIELSGVTFGDGIQYDFVWQATVDAGAYFVLAPDALEFESVYGFSPDAEYLGRLDNAGERLALSDLVLGLDEVTYSDALPWPETPDGDGPSLELVDPALDNADPANWQASYVTGGTPGAANSLPPVIHTADTGVTPIDTADTDVPDTDTDVPDTDTDVPDTDTDVPDTDTDVPDTDPTDTDPVDTDPDEADGCGCATGSGGFPGLLAGLVLFAMRRR